MTASQLSLVIENRSKFDACNIDYKNSATSFEVSVYNMQMLCLPTTKVTTELPDYCCQLCRQLASCLGVRLAKSIGVVLIAVFSFSCSGPAYKQIDASADQLGFVRTTESTSKFRHVVYAPQRKVVGDTVNVYIEGDGAPWQWHTFIRADPTPRGALMLGLMGLDKGNAVYVGRPCYFGLALDDQCNSDYWTFSRFSDKVIDSMVEVISQRTGSFKNVVLIGHSGGGALALLVAEKLANVAAVVTVAGNIDIDAWTTHHGYIKLYGSKNPATRLPLPPSIRQLHLVGGKDKIIPPALVEDWLRRQSSAKIWEVADNTHICCWGNQWPDVLRWIANVQ